MKSVTMPDEIWGRLASVAADRNTTVEELLVAAVMEITKPGSRHERIRQLVRAGYTDVQIAERTGELKAFVGAVRRKAELPPNRQWRTDNERKAS